MFPLTYLSTLVLNYLLEGYFDFSEAGLEFTM